MRVRPEPVLERVPMTGSVAVREFRQSAFRYPWHQHPEVELTWILKGSGLRYVGDSVEPFYEGDFCLLGRNLPHTWLSPEGSAGRVRSLVVQFDPGRWGEMPEFAKITALLERASRGLRFAPEVAAKTLAQMSRKASPLARFTTLLTMLEELADQTGARPLALAPWAGNRRSKADPRVATVLAFLAKNAGGPIAQKDAARLVRLSPAAFTRFFRRAVSKTFSAYLTDLRLSEACRRLLETDHSISRIAFDAGFGNLSTFNRSFRLVRGLSPRAFRKQALGDSA